MKPGIHSHGRAGQTLGVTEYGTSIVCAHPDCLMCFFATNPHDEFCEEHRGLHPETRRRLRMKPLPTLERHQFFPAGDNRVTYQWGPLAEETTVQPGGRYARDEAELLTLVSLVGSGALTVESRSPT